MTEAEKNKNRQEQFKNLLRTHDLAWLQQFYQNGPEARDVVISGCMDATEFGYMVLEVVDEKMKRPTEHKGPAARIMLSLGSALSKITLAEGKAKENLSILEALRQDLLRIKEILSGKD